MARSSVAFKLFLAVEGWIIVVVGLHEEGMEDDIYDAFGEFGQVKSIHFNMDRKTGYAKGYALIEFEKYEEAENAIRQMNGKQMY